MRKTLIVSIPLSFIGGYLIGRKKFKKLFETICDISKDEYQDYVSTFDENDKLYTENLRLEERNEELYEKNSELYDEYFELENENSNLKERLCELELLNNDYEKCLLDVCDLIKDKHICDKIEVLDIFNILCDKHDVDKIIGWDHSSD